MSHPIVHFEILGNDAVRLHSFYRDLFDWKIGEPAAEMGMYAMVEQSSSGVPGGIGQSQDGSSRLTVYVQVPDLQATLDEAVKLGGKVVMPPMEIPGVVSLAQFADPEGNIVGLVKG